MLVRAVIPHYFREINEGETIRLGEGFGSRQRGAKQKRALALQRCLSGLINLRRSNRQLMLDITQAKAEEFDVQSDVRLSKEVSIEIVVAVHSQDTCLDQILLLNHSHLRILLCSDIDPINLGLAARDYLLHHESPADLNLYLEDDLVVHDSLFLDKLIWFAEVTDHQMVLMPHRYESLASSHSCGSLFIDGKICPDFIAHWHRPQKDVFSSSFMHEPPVHFDCPSNPHSGFFALTKNQVKKISCHQLPTDGFVGPLETAATFTVGLSFKIMKPSLRNAMFLCVEHGFPSFLGYVGK